MSTSHKPNKVTRPAAAIKPLSFALFEHYWDTLYVLYITFIFCSGPFYYKMD